VDPGYDLAPLLGDLTSTTIGSPTSNTVVQTPSSVSVSSRLLVTATNPDGPNNATLNQSAMVLSIASAVSIPTSKVVPTSTTVGAITPPPPPPGGDDGLSSGAVAGIVIGTLLGLAALIALAWLFWSYGCCGCGGGGGGRYGTGELVFRQAATSLRGLASLSLSLCHLSAESLQRHCRLSAGCNRTLQPHARTHTSPPPSYTPLVSSLPAGLHGTESAFAFHDPRMIMWHNQLADAKQAAAGGGYQHYLTHKPAVHSGALGPAGVTVHVEADGDDVGAGAGDQQRPGVSKALARDAARFQTYAQ
jgi:hypothetical protein